MANRRYRFPMLGPASIVSFSSVLISFGVATSIGVIFGISPARKAANQDPN